MLGDVEKAGTHRIWKDLAALVVLDDMLSALICDEILRGVFQYWV